MQKVQPVIKFFKELRITDVPIVVVKNDPLVLLLK